MRMVQFPFEVQDSCGERNASQEWWPLSFCCSLGVGFQFNFLPYGINLTQTFLKSSLYLSSKYLLTRCRTPTLVLTHSCTHLWTKVFVKLSRKSFLLRAFFATVSKNQRWQTQRRAQWLTRQWWRHGAGEWKAWRPHIVLCDLHMCKCVIVILGKRKYRCCLLDMELRKGGFISTISRSEV